MLLRPLFAMALPMVATQCSMALMQFADAWMLSMLGKEELAAVAPAGMLILGLTTFGTGFLACVGTFVGQACGRNESASCRSFGVQGIVFAVILGIGALAFAPTARFVFGFFDHDISLYELEVSYFRISILAILPQLVAVGIGFYFIGIQKPKVATVGALLASLLNFLLNYGLIFGKLGFPELGFVGAAWGTVAASTFQCLFMLFAFARNRQPKPIIPVRRSYMAMVKIGVPTGIQDAFDVISWGIIIVYLVGRFGVEHLAATTILIRCMQLSFLPADGVGMALMAIVAKSIGAGNLFRTKLEVQLGMKVIGGYMVTMALLFFFLRYPILRLFSDDPDVIRIGAQAMIFVSLFQIFDAMNIVYVQSLTGAGDTLWTSAVNTFLCIIVLLGGGLLTVELLPELESLGVWMIATLFIALQGLAFRFRWGKRKWMTISLLERSN
jgi:MATE family multidrug resistance protein